MYLNLHNDNSQVALIFFNYSKNDFNKYNLHDHIPRYHKNHTFIKVYVPKLLKIIGRKSLIEIQNYLE